MCKRLPGEQRADVRGQRAEEESAPQRYDKHRRIRRNGNSQSAVYALQEPIAAYNADFEGKNEVLRAKNRLLWDIFDYI
jgi:hypothetical protein